MALYAQDGGNIIALGATTVEQTGMVAGREYEFTSVGGTALVRWGAGDASAADAGFDFAVPPGTTIRSTAPAGVTAVNAIEAETGSTATAQLLIAWVQLK